jgi:hypothetical protein
MATTESSSATVLTPTGSVTLQGGIYLRWLSLKNELTPDGDDVQAHLEYPRVGQVVLPAKHGGGAVQFFRRGLIVESPDGATFVVYGAIYDYYLGIGGISSALGRPTSDEEKAPHGGRVSHFERGDIYWRQDFGFREVRARGAREGPFAPLEQDDRGARGGRFAPLERDHRARFAAGANPFTRSWVDRAAALWGRSVRRVVARVVT